MLLRRLYNRLGKRGPVARLTTRHSAWAFAVLLSKRYIFIIWLCCNPKGPLWRYWTPMELFQNINNIIKEGPPGKTESMYKLLECAIDCSVLTNELFCLRAHGKYRSEAPWQKGAFEGIPPGIPCLFCCFGHWGLGEFSLSKCTMKSQQKEQVNMYGSRMGVGTCKEIY